MLLEWCGDDGEMSDTHLWDAGLCCWQNDAVTMVKCLTIICEMLAYVVGRMMRWRWSNVWQSSVRCWLMLLAEWCGDDGQMSDNHLWDAGLCCWQNDAVTMVKCLTLICEMLAYVVGRMMRWRWSNVWQSSVRCWLMLLAEWCGDDGQMSDTHLWDAGLCCWQNDAVTMVKCLTIICEMLAYVVGRMMRWRWSNVWPSSVRCWRSCRCRPWPPHYTCWWKPR